MNQQVEQYGPNYFTGHTCDWLCRVLCLVGLHRWSRPGSACHCCGKPDDFPRGGTPWEDCYGV